MDMASGEKNLLEKICRGVGYDYLSDLHGPRLNGLLIMRTVCQLRTDGHSLGEWTEAVNYITGSRREFCSAGEAIDFLENYLRGQA